MPKKNPYENNNDGKPYKQRHANSGLLLPLPGKMNELKIKRHRSQSKSINELLGELKHLSPKGAKQRLSQTRII